MKNLNTYIWVFGAGVVLFCQTSCQNSVASQAGADAIAQPIGLEAENNEFFDWNKATINGRLNMIATASQVSSELGRPDSVVKAMPDGISVSFYDKPFDYSYVKGVVFEKYADTLVFSHIDFRENSSAFIASGSVKFNAATTIADVQKQYPETSRVYDTRMEDNSYSTISLATSRALSDDGWMLFFDKASNKLVRIDYWMND